MDENSWKVLSLAAKRGHIGCTREDFFREIRGIAWVELEESVREVEAAGYVHIEWTGIDKFLLTITEKGGEMVRDQYEQRLNAYKARMEDQTKRAGIGKL